MTYNVFGGTLNLAQNQKIKPVHYKLHVHVIQLSRVV